MNITKHLDRLEKLAVDVIAVFAPWLGPIPSAYLVGTAVHEHLGWHWVIAWIAAVAVESIGVVSVLLSLELYEWNDSKNKTDPAAPFGLSAVLVSIYFVVTVGLTVFLDVYPELAKFAPAIFPFLAIVGSVNIAIKKGQKRRVDGKKNRKVARKVAGKLPPETAGKLPVTTTPAFTDWRTVPREARQQISKMSVREICQTYGVKARTGRNWLANARQEAGQENGRLNGIAKQ